MGNIFDHNQRKQREVPNLPPFTFYWGPVTMDMRCPVDGCPSIIQAGKSVCHIIIGGMFITCCMRCADEAFPFVAGCA